MYGAQHVKEPPANAETYRAWARSTPLERPNCRTVGRTRRRPVPLRSAARPASTAVSPASCACSGGVSASASAGVGCWKMPSIGAKARGQKRTRPLDSPGPRHDLARGQPFSPGHAAAARHATRHPARRRKRPAPPAPGSQPTLNGGAAPLQRRQHAFEFGARSGVDPNRIAAPRRSSPDRPPCHPGPTRSPIRNRTRDAAPPRRARHRG